MPKIQIVDPLTLLGRETLQLLAGDPLLAGDLAFLHTADDDEHQIAEIAGEPALVPPIGNADDLAAADAVLVASDTPTSRLLHVSRFAESHPDTPIVVLGRLPGDWDQLPPAAGAHPDRAAMHLRVAHPALVALWTLVGALDHLEPVQGVIAALDPVSAGGTADVERLGDDDLPVGLQVMAPVQADERVYRVGQELETLLLRRWGGPLLDQAPQLEATR